MIAEAVSPVEMVFVVVAAVLLAGVLMAVPFWAAGAAHRSRLRGRR